MFKLTYLIVTLLISGINSIFSQECKCDFKDLDKSIYLLKTRDSIEVFKLISNLKKSSKTECEFQATGLELLFYNTKVNLNNADETFLKLQKVYNNSRCKEKIKTDFYYYASEYFIAKNNYNKLSEFAFKELKEAEKINNKLKQIEALKHVVFLQTRLKESDKNWTYIKKAEKLILAIKDPAFSTRNYRWLAFEYENKFTRTQRKTVLDSSKLFIERAKIGAKKFQLFDELALTYRALEAYSYHKSDLKNALKYIDSAIYYGKKIKGEKNLGPFYLSKAWDHVDLNQNKEAIIYADSAVYYDNSKDLAGNMMVLSEVAQIYESTGNLNKAYSSFKQFSTMKDTILKRDRIKIVNELETKYKTELKDAEIKNLNQQSQIDQLTIEKKQSQINKMIVLFIVAVSLLTFVLFVMKMRELRRTKEKNIALQNAIDKQHELESELTEVRENIAQDFHDDLGNRLARISLISSIVNNELKDNERLKDKVKQITNDSNELYMGTRDFIFSLKENSDYVEELVTYLTDFGEDFFSKNQIQFKVSKDIDENIKLPYYWSRQLIFIFKETMTNAFKHANCKSVQLIFELNNNILQISFSDDGKGIDLDKLNSSNGIKNMKSRAKKIGGELNFISSEYGTSIKFIGDVKSN